MNCTAPGPQDLLNQLLLHDTNVPAQAVFAWAGELMLGIACPKGRAAGSACIKESYRWAGLCGASAWVLWDEAGTDLK
jgi:hypothetical protein